MGGWVVVDTQFCFAVKYLLSNQIATFQVEWLHLNMQLMGFVCLYLYFNLNVSQYKVYEVEWEWPMQLHVEPESLLMLYTPTNVMVRSLDSTTVYQQDILSLTSNSI